MRIRRTRLLHRLALLSSLGALLVSLPACGAPDCDPASKDGPRKGEELSTEAGTAFEVVTPSGYSHRSARGLLVAYAGSGGSIGNILDDWGLVEADREHIIAAVAPAPPANGAALDDLASVISTVRDRYCVAEDSVALTGHSDGGTTAALLGLWTAEEDVVAVAPSGAGVRPSDLGQVGCSAWALDVLVLHSADDATFPDRGEASAGWWADCLGCGPPTEEDGCMVYPDCGTGSSVRFCAGSGSHATWPIERVPDILGLLDP